MQVLAANVLMGISIVKIVYTRFLPRQENQPNLVVKWTLLLYCE